LQVIIEHCEKHATLARRFDRIVARDSFFHLHAEDPRQMFAVFAKHSSDKAMLMFNTGPEHGEAIGSYRGNRDIMQV
jgi:hypothetical protein